MNYKICWFIIIVFFATACEKALIPDLENSPKAVFDELWKHVDENYIYFDLKQVDWQEQYNKYVPLIKIDMSEEALFQVCLDMLNELKDGHNRLQNRTMNKRYAFEEDYEILFDIEVVKNNYLKGTFQEEGNFTYGILEGNIGYIHFKDFEGARRIQKVMEFMDEQKVIGVVFDIRNNGGGEGAEDIVPYFINESTVVGYTIEKTGKAHQDISENLSFRVEPTNMYFDKPVVLLINRASFSATTYFAAMMKYLPNVTLIGQITGGGGGGNAAYRLQNGWIVRVSVSTFLDVQFNDIESGVTPDIQINNTEEILAQGVDEMLDRAIEEIN